MISGSPGRVEVESIVRLHLQKRVHQRHAINDNNDMKFNPQDPHIRIQQYYTKDSVYRA